MAKEDLANTIYEERLQVGIEMVMRIQDKNNFFKNLSAWEVLDIATRIASSLFIEKNKQYRADRIKRD